MMYDFIRHVVAFATHCHYSRLVIKGKENLPTDGNYIIAPCHQNALMDPLLMLLITPKPVWFLCRGDIFEKPTIRKILTFLKILPVYRIRDGRKAVEQDTKIFTQSRDILVSGLPLCLMAEGRHTDRHQLLPLGKGMFRIAADAQQHLAPKPLYIVPVGIDYSHYERPYSKVVVNIAKPLYVQPFLDEAGGQVEKSWQLMRSAVAPAMRDAMFHIDSKEYYQQFYNLCLKHNAQKRRQLNLRNNAYGRFLANQALAKQYDAIEQQAREGDPNAQQQLGALLYEAKHFRYRHIAGPIIIAATAAAVLFPIVRQVLLWLFIIYPLPIVPTHLISKILIKDPQFRSSINFAIRLVLSVIYIPIMSIVIGCTHGLLYGLGALASSLIIARLSGPLNHIIMRR